MANNLEEQFLNILDTDKERMLRICRSYAGSNDDVNDLFQEVVLNIWKALPEFKGEANIQTWVYRITLNVCLRSRYMLQKQEKRRVHLESIDIENMPDTPAPAEENKFAALYTCIQQLNPADKSVILLFLEDMPYKEISTITGLSENHVAVKIKRIKGKLFTCLNVKEDVRR